MAGPYKRVHEPVIAVAVANRIRERRIALGMSQQAIADAIGMTYQQVCKYERGTNRITVDALYRIAAALGTDVGDLLAGISMGGDVPAQIGRDRAGIEHAKAFQALPAHLRAAATETIRAMGRAA